MENRNALESKYQRILNELGEQATFYIEDIQRIFPDMKKSTLYWNMSKLVDGGYLKRVRNGVYSFNEWKGKKNVSLSQTAEKIRDILDETGFDYYISGLDILQKYMLHIPEQYPIVICIQKESKNELTDILTNHFYEVVEPRRLKEKYEAIQYNGKNNDIIIIYLTENFEDSEDGLATIEKAFVDLYYAVTRNGYPLALQEFLTQISFLALCAFVNRLGLQASSGYGVACKIVNFAILIPTTVWSKYYGSMTKSNC